MIYKLNVLMITYPTHSGLVLVFNVDIGGLAEN